MINNKEELRSKVIVALDQLRPFLHADGGDMELIDITDDAIVQVRLLGSCSDCSMSQMTIKGGLEEALKMAAPELKGVVAV
ncbi:MAG: NifU family protein [Crocinitomicaceae bacterium]|jgi:Fe-S cluster biogenesis protein NfuA|nr:NifU family protein [Crocinitomicaceae bacterium]MDP4595444.1 NifU family protein [Crocinitomicaceae bacterium]MDP4723668.1 NifU family protein [Crocinitomicaceae bacterium]MDP4738545.1 NifU family protein [Crocinitomicaceae bacterium]MDP4798665.1 NifU family protein [Crocinitomicaceae bacterium]